MPPTTQGGLQAVRCMGSGSVANVRIIQHTNATWFWFDVDATVPRVTPPSATPPSATPPSVCPPPTPLNSCHRDAVRNYVCVGGVACEDLDARAACHHCTRRRRLA